MVQVTVEEADGQLPRLIQEAFNGEEVIITNGETLRAQLAPLPKKRRPLLGTAEGQVWIADDFDAPLDDFNAYLETAFESNRQERSLQA